MNETINGMIEQIKARKNKKFGKVPVVLVCYKHKISIIERAELPDTCDALHITIQAHPSQEKRLRNVFTIVRDHIYEGFDGWFKYKGQVIEPSIVFTTGQCFNDNVIMLLIKESEILKSFCNKIKDVVENQKFEYTTNNEIPVSNVTIDNKLQEQMDRIAEECNKTLGLEQYLEDNIGPATKSFRKRYADYWKGCCDVLREKPPIKEYHGIVMPSDPPEVEPMQLDAAAELSILEQFSDDIKIGFFDDTDLLALGMEAKDETRLEKTEEA